MESDAQLLEACRSGETAAFAELVDRYQGLVCAVTFAATGDRELSEDLAQDTFVAAWRQLAELREPTRFRAWLCGIARNLAAKARRRFGREVAVDAIEVVDAAPAHDEALADEQAEALVWKALESLAPTYREPLILYYREGRSATQVAEALGLSVAAVEQRLSRGRKQLEAGVEALVERSLERSRPQRRLAVAVMGAIEIGGAGSAGVASQGGLTMKTLSITAAAAVAVAGGYITCSGGGDDHDEERMAVRTVEHESGTQDGAAGRTGVAAEVVDRIEARDRTADADATELPAFELTRMSDRQVAVNIEGGPSTLQTASQFLGIAPDPPRDPVRTISGRVLDPDGHAIGGAVVIGGEGVRMHVGRSMTSETGAITDERGRFAFTLGQAEAGTVVALHRRGVSEVATLPAGTDDRTLDLRLRPPATFAGTVRQGGEPVDGSVTLSSDPANASFTANCDGTGSFELAYVPPGRYSAAATVPYQAAQTENARVAAEVVIEAGAETRHDFVLPTGALVVTDVAWPEEPDVATLSYYLLPGKHAPASAEELTALAKAERLARFLLVGGDNLHDAMSFSDVAPGPITACAVARRDRDTVVGFDCTQLDVDEGAQSYTIELDPFGDYIEQ
jgi:RNA polymerase sigma factor (sigma-70 family)